MRKIIALIMLLLPLECIIMTAQEVANSQVTALAQDVDTMEFRWTVGAKGGLTYFHTYGAQEGVAWVKDPSVLSQISYNASLFSEYAFNPIMSCGVSLGNYSFDRPGLYGGSLETIIYGQLNVLNLFARDNRSHLDHLFHMNMYLGLGGAMLYRRFDKPGQLLSDDKYMYKGFGAGLLGLQFELFPVRYLSIVADANYHLYLGDNKNANVFLETSNSIIQAFSISVGLRYYFKNKNYKPANPVAMVSNPIVPAIPAIVEVVEEAEIVPVEPIATRNDFEKIEQQMRLIAEQGNGVLEIPEFTFNEDGSLSLDSRLVLDRIADSLLESTQWKKLNMVLVCGDDAVMRATNIESYLHSKGMTDVVVIGREAKDSSVGSNLMLSVK